MVLVYILFESEDYPLAQEHFPGIYERQGLSGT